MPKKDNTNPNVITPVDVVQRKNPLVKDIAKISEKWHNRWPKIERPWPKEGTFNPDVIKIIQVLVTTHKACEDKGKKGEQRKEKRKQELAILQLFEIEGQRWLTAVRNQSEKYAKDMKKNNKQIEKMMMEINAPFSHLTQVRGSPTVGEELTFKEIYPQLPVITQEGDYLIKDEDDRIKEMGKAETIIKMYPTTKAKSKQKSKHLIIQDDDDNDDDGSDLGDIMGGYDPAVKRILTKAEKRGGKTGKKKDLRKDTSDKSDGDGSDENSDSPVSWDDLQPLSSTAEAIDATRRSLKKINENIDECISHLGKSTTSESQEVLLDQLHALRIQKKKLKKGSEDTDTGYSLRSRKKIFPVLVRGQTLEYKPWQNTDMSDVLEKLPILQDGAHPWISKLEEIMVGTQPAMGDIKRLLANLLGVPAMEEILQKAGLHRYVGTAVNDSELFAANRGRMWAALKDTFRTNVHPDNILIEPLRQEENPRAYVTRAHQVWRSVTGNDPEANQMEQSILRAKIQMGLPLPVRSKLAEVFGLANMTKSMYQDHVAHQVELHRKKEYDQKMQDQEALRKLTQVQLGESKKERKQALVI